MAEIREFISSQSKRVTLRRSAVSAVWEMDHFAIGDDPLVGARVNGMTVELQATYEDVRDWMSRDD